MSAATNTAVPAPATDPSTISPAKAIVRAVAAALGLTTAWGVLAGATEHHFAFASLLVGLALARVLTSTGARRTWFPLLAAALALAVGFLGDVLGVGLDLSRRYDIPAGFLFDHAGELLDNVSAHHSFLDWVFFTLAAVCAAALTASRQQLGADPFTRNLGADRRPADTCPEPSGTRRP
jgi:hypothetical protein